MANKPSYSDLEKIIADLRQELAERYRTEEILQRSEEKYRNIVETIEEGYYEVDLAGNNTFFNETLCRILGRSPEEMRGLSNRDYTTPETQKRIFAIFNEIYRGGPPVKVIDYEIIRKDGSIIMAEFSAALLKDRSGNPIGFRGIVRDRTEQKKAEIALEESEEKYRLLVENAHDGIYILQDGVVKFSNPRIEALTGYTSEELAKMPFLNLVYPKDKEKVEAWQSKVLAGNDLTDTFTFQMINRHNETLWVELDAVVINWENYPATLNFLRDVTDQKKMEFQFIQAQKMEAIGTLAGGIAHDFNNLLMGIQGNASLILLDTASDHPHYTKLKNIEQQVQAGAALTRQLLGVAKGGKYEVRPTDINRLIREGLDLYGRTRKEITIHQFFEEDIWAVEVDRSQIEQVLLNLYVNAGHAMPGGGDLYVETKNVTLDEKYTNPLGLVPGRYVRTSVTDTGMGMDEATRKRAFDPFFTTREMGRGTGLGLASAYGIIKNHNGIINIYSEKGKGTTFNIYLPTTEKSFVQDKAIPSEIQKGNETILFVDDQENIAEVGESLLKELGYRVFTVRSGTEAIEVYRREGSRIDLVILDMIMPEMGGGETFDRLKEIDPQVKVLLSSGYSINGQAKDILDRGCRGFMQKPFNLADLSKKVRQILDEKKD
ncbi:MAG: PAS domain S-box protein [Deltaproteobacteria bacterium]|nr:PAS domain S-box protein [Deltaproteobacteria bacterium]